MSRNIRIATFSVKKYSVEKEMSYVEMVNRYTQFWKVHFDKLIPSKPDIIVMPECSNRPADGIEREKIIDYYEAVSDETLALVSETANRNSCYIVCNQARKFNDKWYNTSTVFDRDGIECGHYRKNFLVPEEHVDGKMEFGRTAELIETDFGNIACVTCFDLNFDWLREHYRKLKPDLIIFSSMYHGGGQQMIWSWLCKCHFVGAMGHREIPGEIRNPFGEVLYSTSNYFDYVCGSVNLDCQIVHLDRNWGKLDALKTKYGNKVTVYDPGEFGCVMVSSESDQMSSRQMLEEFNIYDYESYMIESQNIRNGIK